MDVSMKAACGTYCGVCEWRAQTGCRGCQACAAKVSWGECRIARCCLEKGLEHCGFCPEMPCRMLTEAFQDPEHGDNGARLHNLQNWTKGIDTYERLR